jgi:hypothetical protein
MVNLDRSTAIGSTGLLKTNEYKIMATEQTVSTTRRKPTPTPKPGIDLNVIKKYIEKGYMAGWGEGYVWNDELVILRKPNNNKFDYVIISKSNKEVFINNAD